MVGSACAVDGTRSAYRWSSGRDCLRGFVDLLALTHDGSVVILELKRDRTPREVVAQILDYGSWIRGITPKDIHEIASGYLSMPLAAAFSDFFGENVPENLCHAHRMIIVAAEFDAASRRIVEYLSDGYGVDINTLFFNTFDLQGELLVTTDWLIDESTVAEKARTRKEINWSGQWYVNAGDESPYKSWDDMRRYNFIAAGGGPRFSGPLKKLKPGDTFSLISPKPAI